MQKRSLKKWLLWVLLILLALLAGYFLISGGEEIEDEEIETPQKVEKKEIIGESVEGRDIVSYSYGDGQKELLFVGGVHGGYEWNSTLLSFALIDYLDSNPEVIPQNLSVAVIPTLNPDGLFRVVEKEGRFNESDVSTATDQALGRFNSNGVDLNRNFDCKWQPESTWRGEIVSAGISPFSEPEARALRDYVMKKSPEAVVFFHSQANAVYASECHEGVLPETLDIMSAYSSASGYKAVESFDAYEITGDAEGWLASIGVPALTVEMSTHEDVEWERNLAGVKALLEYYKM